ncbi:hypothetical protein [Carboxylicivirga sp. RSCT41]|uniref:hypothetical protein n=1 Tax=Carboxylicivirga agarovorans TaxID=3417570 RepID=UPI003D34833A
MKYRIKNTKTTIRIIAIYQIIGGIHGIGLICWLLLRTGQINGPLFFIFSLAFFLFGLSIRSGNLLLKKDSLKSGLIFSSILQGLQIIAIGIGGYTYEFFSGAKATIGIEFTNGIGFDLNGALSTFNFHIQASDPDYFIKVNVLAIIILSILIDIYEKQYNRKEPVKEKVLSDSTLTENESKIKK